MNKSRISRLLKLALCAALLAPSASTAQNKPSRLARANGMVADEGGGWRFPTPADALQVLREEWKGRSAQAVLRQEFESRPQAELDALANELADILLAGNPEFGSDAEKIQRAAASALVMSAKRVKWWIAGLDRWQEDDEATPGTPFAGAFDALVRVYETRAARALANGGTDPFQEAYREGRPIGLSSGYTDLIAALGDIYWADPPGIGGDYLLALLETAEPPEPPGPRDYDAHLQFAIGPVKGLWCQAAHMLRGDGFLTVLPGGRLSELPAIARDDESFLARCDEIRYEGGYTTVVRGDPTTLRQGGSPPDGFELMREVYEASAARALRGGGSDPMLEAARRGEDPALLAAQLRSVFEADPAARGVNYLLALLETSEPPEPGEPPPASLWCEAARLLRESQWRARLPDIARDDRSFVSRCKPLAAAGLPLPVGYQGLSR